MGEGAGRFPPPARPPAKMSDMEDDFMCDDEEDYDLVRAGRGGRRARRGDLAGSAASGAVPRRQAGCAPRGGRGPPGPALLSGSASAGRCSADGGADRAGPGPGARFGVRLRN